MIVKSLSRKSGTNQLLRYIFRYIFNESALGINATILKHNIRSKDITGFIKEFKANAAMRAHTRSNQVAVYHSILSWSNIDSHLITDEMVKAMVKQFIKLRGANNLYVGAIHKDKSHVHVHLAVSATQLNGKSSRISQKEFANIKLALDAYQRQQYPQLIHSLQDHGKTWRTYQKRKESLLELAKLRQKASLTNDRTTAIPSPIQYSQHTEISDLQMLRLRSKSRSHLELTK